MSGSEAGLRRITLPLGSPEAVSAFLRLGKQDCRDAAPFNDLPQRLVRYFQGDIIRLDDKLDFSDVTSFQRSVLEASGSVPYGETRSYIWVARMTGNPKAARAVGQALAHNPFPIVIPCHRIIQSSGQPGGFGGGTEMKRRLLNMESACFYKSSL